MSADHKPVTIESLRAKSKEELVTELMRALEEINELRADLNQRQSSTFVPLDKQPYTISMSVLNITGNAAQRICRSIPLADVINRSVQRPDEREADTPVVGDAQGRVSCEIGRFSGFSVTSSEGGLQLPEGLSPVRSEGRPSEGGRLSMVMSASPQESTAAGKQSALAPASAAMNKIGRPSPLLHIAGPIDSDSIISQHTLHAFARLNIGGPMSPVSSHAANVMHYIMDVFARNNEYSHDHSQPHLLEGFGRTLLRLCDEAERILADEPRHPTVASPVYVFGDIHGNFRDLHYFITQIMNFDDLRFVPYRLMFLGDYVDRGDFGVECVAFLIALKVLSPHKITLLRGNHEDTLVNGDKNLYRETSFRWQCEALFGPILGQEVWARCNRVFSFLPLTANIDNRIFCTHGGLPRWAGGDDNRMDMLMRSDFPRFESFFQLPDSEPRLHTVCRQIASDVCWSDPADNERDVNEFGFGPNPRGNGVILFGATAVDAFLEKYNFEYIFRAHQEKSDGVKISKNARVVTIFSTSGYVGHSNGAGVIYVGDKRIRLIVKEADEAIPDDLGY